MTKKKLANCVTEPSLFSKEAIFLPPNRRLKLLLEAKRYYIVKKRTSAKAQIREMIELYNICSIMITQFFPNDSANHNFLIINALVSNSKDESIITEKLSNAFSMLKEFEDLESKITSIQILLYEYKYYYPDLYEHYNLYTITTKPISAIIDDTKKMIQDCPQFVEDVLRRWEFL